jgi:hypothetical protein
MVYLEEADDNLALTVGRAKAGQARVLAGPVRPAGASGTPDLAQIFELSFA